MTARSRGCDAIIHLAAVADVNDVVADPAKAEQVNSEGRCKVLEAARRRASAGRLREHDLGLLRLPGDARWTRTPRSRRPSHLYTATKLAGEHYCQSYSELYGVEYTILRFGIPYGPRARDADRARRVLREGAERRAR